MKRYDIFSYMTEYLISSEPYKLSPMGLFSYKMGHTLEEIFYDFYEVGAKGHSTPRSFPSSSRSGEDIAGRSRRC
jgi:hypothetical protein